MGFLLSLLSVGGLHAQQLPLFSQYMLNDYFQNPAIAGSRPTVDAVSANRLQWTGLTDAPRTYALSLNGPIKAKNMGVGGYVYSDVTGPTRRMGISGSYAYHIRLAEKIKVSLSLSAGLMQFAVDATKLTLADANDNVFSGYESKLVPDLGTSFYLYGVPDANQTGQWWVGGYIPQLFQSKLNLFSTPKPTGVLATHMYFTGGYRLSITDEFAAEPTLMVKMVSPTPVQLDAGLRLLYKNKVWLGGTYRTGDAMSVMVGYLHKENLMLGYSYDITTTNLKNYSNATHELMIGMRFKVPAAPSAPKTAEE